MWKGHDGSEGVRITECEWAGNFICKNRLILSIFGKLRVSSSFRDLNSPGYEIKINLW